MKKRKGQHQAETSSYRYGEDTEGFQTRARCEGIYVLKGHSLVWADKDLWRPDGIRGEPPQARHTMLTA